MQAVAPHLTRVRVGAATLASQHRSRMHFWRNLPTVPTYCALICAAEGSYGYPKYILLDDAQMPDAHTPQVGDLGIHGASPKCKSWNAQHTNSGSSTPTVPRCRFTPSCTLFATILVAACTSWGLLTVSECPELQNQKQHVVPSTRCIYQDWKSDLTILYHLADCGLESAEHN